jgi:hypothetical protein
MLPVTYGERIKGYAKNRNDYQDAHRNLAAALLDHSRIRRIRFDLIASARADSAGCDQHD